MKVPQKVLMYYLQKEQVGAVTYEIEQLMFICNQNSILSDSFLKIGPFSLALSYNAKATIFEGWSTRKLESKKKYEKGNLEKV